MTGLIDSFNEWLQRRPGIKGTRASTHLDLIRGAAAVCVLVYHVRYRFFLDYAEVPAATLFHKAFYTATSFGHDAVMVFFVLSGYFIATGALRDFATGGWSWRSYTTKRLARLWVVLAPGLLLTLAWDSLGLSLGGDHLIYTAGESAWRNDYFPVADRMTAAGFWGNLVFLQTIRVPPFGSNEPLWSLSFEFWYYAIFPCLASALLGGPKWRSLGWVVATVLLGCFVGPTIVAYFPIWLLGGAIGAAPQCGPLLRSAGLRRAATAAAACTFVAAAVAGHFSATREALGGSTLATDYVTAVGFSMLLFVLLHDRKTQAGGAYDRFAHALAGFSFSLYVCHMPILLFIRSRFTGDEPWDLTLGAGAGAFAITAIAIAYAWGLAAITERHTERVRRAVDRFFARRIAARRPADNAAASEIQAAKN